MAEMEGQDAAKIKEARDCAQHMRDYRANRTIRTGPYTSRVVAFLRAKAEHADGHAMTWLLEAADEIERGEFE